MSQINERGDQSKEILRQENETLKFKIKEIVEVRK
jgi:hypothetical protein